MFRVIVIKEINVRIIEIIREIIKWVMKKIIKEVKWYLEDDDCYLKTVFIRLYLIWIW